MIEFRLGKLGALVALVATPPEPEDIPALAAVPGRVTSFVIEPDPDAPNLLDDIVAKVTAEDARLRRMLPPAPPGMSWHGEIQSTETPEDFMRNAGPHVRIRYRLVDNRTGDAKRYES